MTSMLTLAVVLLAGFGDDAAKTAAKEFEGTWQLTSAISDGKKTPDDIVKKIRVVIKDGKHTVYFEKEAIAKEIPFAVDATQSPKTTDDTLPDGTTIKGIFKIEGDTLTSCVAGVGKDRPTKFESKEGSGHTLRVFTRVKP